MTEVHISLSTNELLMGLACDFFLIILAGVENALASDDGVKAASLFSPSQ